MPQINRSAMLQKLSHTSVKKIETPEWGDDGFVYVRQLQASDAKRIEGIGKADEAHALAEWCVLGICDKSGTPVLSDGDVDKLLQAPMSVIQRCVTAILKINGLAEEDESERKKSDGRSRQDVRIRPRKRARAR